jgi:hypothetical protein
VNGEGRSGPPDGEPRDVFRRPDFYAGLILSAVSFGIIAESWRMPRDLLGWPPYAGPGIVTGVLAVGLLAMSLTLLIRAYRRPGVNLGVAVPEIRRYLADPRTRRLAVMAALSVAYVAALGRGIPYPITTGAYLVVTMVLFRAAAWWAIVLIAGLVTGGITLVFNRIFLIPLP